MDQYWLTIVIILLIVGIIFDGVRRMRNARRDSIKMSLRPVQRDPDSFDEDEEYGSEFPNGGARVSDRKIDAERIKEARSKYNFGSDIPAWKDKLVNKINEQTQAGESPAVRVEPSVDGDPDPLLQDPHETSIDEAVLTADHETAEEIEWHSETVTESVQSPLQPPPQQQQPSSPSKTHSSADDVAAEKVPTKTPEEPVQASLNLEDTVPMLMDSLEDSADDTEVDEALEEVHVEESQADIRSVGSNIDAEAVHTRSANKPRYESKYTDHQSMTKNVVSESPAQTPQAVPEAVLVIHVRAPEKEYFYGSDLLELILDNGLRYGAMDIFHCHADEDGEGPVLFSMANMVKPGTFDLHTFEHFSTVGLSFFMNLPTESGNHMEAFERMLDAAKNIAEQLDGELKDEQRSILTKQTIEHYRERIRDFSRKQQLEKNKL